MLFHNILRHSSAVVDYLQFQMLGIPSDINFSNLMRILLLLMCLQSNGIDTVLGELS